MFCLTLISPGKYCNSLCKKCLRPQGPKHRQLIGLENPQAVGKSKVVTIRGWTTKETLHRLLYQSVDGKRQGQRCAESCARPPGAQRTPCLQALPAFRSTQRVQHCPDREHPSQPASGQRLRRRVSRGQVPEEWGRNSEGVEGRCTGHVR